jgi:hypothetical protein
MPRPPRLAVRFLEWRLPGEVAEAICGDLEHEYRERIEGGQRRTAADIWFGGQALTVRAGALRRAARRVQRVRPSSVGTRGRRATGFSWLDVRLGMRMLRKHPVMTLAAVFALAAGIPMGLAPMHLADAFEAPIPEDEGDRIRGLRYSDQASSQPVAPTYFEFALWRDELTTFQAIGAARTGNHNLPSEGGSGAPVLGAEVTASTFGQTGGKLLKDRALSKLLREDWPATLEELEEGVETRRKG